MSAVLASKAHVPLIPVSPIGEWQRDAGTQPGLSYSLQYAPPEIVAAVETGESTVLADSAADMWALGVIAYELLTRSRTFSRSLSRHEIRDQIAGRAPLPWEGEGRQPRLQQLRILKRTVLACLARDPKRRPTAETLLRSWNRLFDAISSTTATTSGTVPSLGTTAIKAALE